MFYKLFGLKENITFKTLKNPKNFRTRVTKVSDILFSRFIFYRARQNYKNQYIFSGIDSKSIILTTSRWSRLLRSENIKTRRRDQWKPCRLLLLLYQVSLIHLCQRIFSQMSLGSVHIMQETRNKLAISYSLQCELTLSKRINLLQKNKVFSLCKKTVV